MKNVKILHEHFSAPIPKWFLGDYQAKLYDHRAHTYFAERPTSLDGP
ncbi:MAG: hypothetical protein J7L66_06085 [Anaerolineaceae bacterium]|nr:hypothetical protein [Anaerolineaceae bacterium]